MQSSSTILENKPADDKATSVSFFGKFFSVFTWVVAFLISVLLFFNILYRSTTICLVCLALGAIDILFAQPEDSLGLMLYLSSFSLLFRTTKTSTPYSTYLFLAWYAIYLLKEIGKPVDKRIIPVFFLYLFFFMYCVVIHFAYKNYDSLFSTLSFLFYTALPLLLFQHGEGNWSIPKLLAYLLLGYLIASGIGTWYLYYSKASALTLAYLIEASGRESFTILGSITLYRNAGSFTDPNYFAFNGMAFAALAYGFLDKLKKGKLFFGILGLLCFLMALTSVSKMAMIVAVLFVTITFVSGVFRGGKARIICLIAALAIAGFLGFYGYRLGSVLTTRLTSYSDDFLDSLTTNRASLFAGYYRLFIQHPLVFLFGEGPSNVGIEYFGLTTHNVFLGGLFHFGLIGFSVFIAYWIMIYRLFVPNPLHQPLRYWGSWLLVWFICGLALNLEATGMNALYLTVWICCLISASKKDQEIARALSLAERRYRYGI